MLLSTHRLTRYAIAVSPIFMTLGACGEDEPAAAVTDVASGDASVDGREETDAAASAPPSTSSDGASGQGSEDGAPEGSGEAGSPDGGGDAASSEAGGDGSSADAANDAPVPCTSTSFVDGYATIAEDLAGLYAWTNPSNATTSNDQRASVQVLSGKTSNTLGLSGFGISVPSNATITGVEVFVERYSAYGAVRDASSFLAVLGAGGSPKPMLTDWPTVESVATYGSPSDTWAIALTPANVGGLEFWVSAHSPPPYNDYAYVDSVKARVHYCP